MCSSHFAANISNGSREEWYGIGSGYDSGNLYFYPAAGGGTFPSGKEGEGDTEIPDGEGHDHRNQADTGGLLWDMPEPGRISGCAGGWNGKRLWGEISSKQAVDTIKDMFANYRSAENPAYFFRNAFHRANASILEVLDDGRGGASAGIVLIKENYLYYAVVGNVKAAVFRKGDLVPVSVGHTIDMLVEDRFMEGRITKEEALKRLEDKRVYNYLGQERFEEVEFFDTSIRLKEKDIVVLMSDGLYEGVEWKTIEEILAGKKKCQQKAFEIIEAVNAGSQEKKDNASIVLVEVFVD